METSIPTRIQRDRHLGPRSRGKDKQQVHRKAGEEKRNHWRGVGGGWRKRPREEKGNKKPLWSLRRNNKFIKERGDVLVLRNQIQQGREGKQMLGVPGALSRALARLCS